MLLQCSCGNVTAVTDIGCTYKCIALLSKLQHQLPYYMCVLSIKLFVKVRTSLFWLSMSLITLTGLLTFAPAVHVVTTLCQTQLAQWH